MSRMPCALHTGTHSPLGAMIEQDGKGDMSRFDQVAARLEQSAEALAHAAQTADAGHAGAVESRRCAAMSPG